MSNEPSVIRMANDIARNQAHLPTADAAALIASHIRSFWDPRMRAELARLVAADPRRSVRWSSRRCRISPRM